MDGLNVVSVELVWRVIGNNLVDLGSIWWENPQIVDHLDALRKVSRIDKVVILARG